MPNITLVDIAERSDSKTSKVFAQQVIQRNPVISRLMMEPLDGDIIYKWDAEGDLPEVFLRPLGGTVAESKATSQKGEVHLKFVSSKFTLDNRTKNIKNRQGSTEWGFQLKQHSKSMGFKLSDMLINGNTAIEPKEPNGIKAWIDAYYDSTDNPDIKFKYDTANNTNGLQITDSQVLVDNMELLQNALVSGTDEFWCNKSLLANFVSLLLQANNTTLANKFRMETIVFAGKKVRIGMWDDIPMYPMFNKFDNVSPIIGYNETTGNSDLTTSIYAVSLGEDFFHGLIQDTQGVYVERIPNSDFGERWTLDFPINFIMKHPQSAARMTGILI